MVMVTAEFISHFKSCENYPKEQLVFLPSTFDLDSTLDIALKFNPRHKLGSPMT